MTKRYMYLLMLGHLCTDIAQGALPAILPFLIVQQSLSYASAATLLMGSSLVSSVVQPLFGYWGDKVSRPWLMSLGMVLSGSGIAGIGFAPSFGVALAAAAVSGFGVALFHPEGGKIANFVSGDKKGVGISIFAVGGNLGFALGPIMTTVALSLWGLSGTIIFLIPPLVMGGVLLTYTARFREISLSVKQSQKAGDVQRQDEWGSFAKVTSVSFCRAILYYGLLTFIPLFFINVFSQLEGDANAKLSVFSLACAIATLAGGRLSDRLGFQRIIRGCYILLLPMLFILIQANSALVATLLIIPIGLALNGSHSSLIALGQSFIPNHVGFASGISLGLAISIGGICAPGIGWIGDRYGVMAAMYTITGIAALTLLLTFLLPKPQT